jgi:hypothetical protein
MVLASLFLWIPLLLGGGRVLGLLPSIFLSPLTSCLRHMQVWGGVTIYSKVDLSTLVELTLPWILPIFVSTISLSVPEVVWSSHTGVYHCAYPSH